MQAIANAFTFLINSIADLYALVLILRVILVWMQANYFNPLARMIAKLTDIFIKPLKRILPTKHRIEFASIVSLLIIESVKFLLIGIITVGTPDLVGIMLLTLAEIFKMTINVFFYAILLQVVLSWVPYGSPETYELIAQITAPIMRPIRRLIKPVGGFDISPIPALIALQFTIILLIDPIYSIGTHMAFG